MLTFIKKIVSAKSELPDSKDIKIGDFIVGRYTSSQWADRLPWEDWHHAALISKLKPLTVIEAFGPNLENGPAEISFKNSPAWGETKSLIKMEWLRPKFPDPIREMAEKTVPRSKRKIITEEEARVRAVDYARKQIGEKYSIWASKWSESKWYSSLLIFKSYSRTVTDMYLEDYDEGDLRAGPIVTPEDLIDSPRSEVYFTWTYKKDV